MRRPRFGLRLLFAMIAVIAAALATVGRRTYLNYEAHRIVERYACNSNPGGRDDWQRRAEVWVKDRLPDKVALCVWPGQAKNIVRFEGQNAPWVKLHDADLRELSSMERLAVLHIRPENVDPSDPITDAGVKHLARCRNLVELCVCSDRLTDVSLEAVSGIATLQGLAICSNSITDNGVRHLARLPALRSLGLGTWPHAVGQPKANVTDAAVEQLGQLKSLKVIDIDGTQITLEGADRLRKLLPGARVIGPSSEHVIFSY
jgi:hypothetical protein